MKLALRLLLLIQLISIVGLTTQHFVLRKAAPKDYRVFSSAGTDTKPTEKDFQKLMPSETEKILSVVRLVIGILAFSLGVIAWIRLFGMSPRGPRSFIVAMIGQAGVLVIAAVRNTSTTSLEVARDSEFLISVQVISLIGIGICTWIGWKRNLFVEAAT